VNEAFGITLLEAMAAGTPVVATTTNGPATLGPDGVNGLIVPPKDADALATAAIRLLEDRPLAAKMAASAHERARLFDWENVAIQLLDYYQEVGATNR
jgi:glycosyltransferase involved in cell wall biosynthesis